MTTKYDIGQDVKLKFKVKSIDVRQIQEKTETGTVTKDVIFYKVESTTNRGKVILDLKEDEITE